jgi:hypothetical protein
LPTEIIPSQHLSELPDGKTPSAMLPVYTDRIVPSVYTGGIADGEKFWQEGFLCWQS